MLLLCNYISARLINIKQMFLQLPNCVMNSTHLTNRSQKQKYTNSSETELHRDCFALHRQRDQHYNNVQWGQFDEFVYT